MYFVIVTILQRIILFPPVIFHQNIHWRDFKGKMLKGESTRMLCHSTEDHLRKNTLDKSEDLSKWALLEKFDYSSG